MINVNKIEYYCNGEFLVDYAGTSNIPQTYDQLVRTASNFNVFGDKLKLFMRELKIKKITKVNYEPERIIIYKSNINDDLDDLFGFNDNMSL